MHEMPFGLSYRRNEKAPDWIFPLFDYRHTAIKKSIWLLKYKGKKRFANIFAEVMYGKIIEELSELSVMKNFSEPILIPIPLSKKRHRERGYNQAELICNELIKINDLRHGINFKLEKEYFNKNKRNRASGKYQRPERQIEKSFRFFFLKNPEIIKSKNIILIDDVTTTGATLNEAKKILKQSGAKKIIAFTVAH